MADYVIVGAGSAGCVLASRLSEDPDVEVLAARGGRPRYGDRAPRPGDVPALFKSGLDWDLLGEPEPGLGGRRLYLPRGRVIGGSSSINAMIYLRGNRADFDEWAELGCTGWSYDEVLPYFKRSEDNERGENEFHGVGGPLAVSDSRSMSPLDRRAARGGDPGRLRAHRRPERRPAGGRRALPAHAAERHAVQRRRRVPAPGVKERPNLEVTSGVFVERHRLRGRPRRGRRARPRTARARPSGPSAR